MTLEYPAWALAMIVMLIVFASLPVPIGYVHSMLKNRSDRNTHSEERGGQEMHRELYTKCSTTEQLDSSSQYRAPSEEDEARPRTAFLPIGSEQYQLLSQQEEEDEEQDTRVWAWLWKNSSLLMDKMMNHAECTRRREGDGNMEGGRPWGELFRRWVFGLYHVIIFSQPLLVDSLKLF